MEVRRWNPQTGSLAVPDRRGSRQRPCRDLSGGREDDRGEGRGLWREHLLCRRSRLDTRRRCARPRRRGHRSTARKRSSWTIWGRRSDGCSGVCSFTGLIRVPPMGCSDCARKPRFVRFRPPRGWRSTGSWDGRPSAPFESNRHDRRVRLGARMLSNFEGARCPTRSSTSPIRTRRRISGASSTIRSHVHRNIGGSPEHSLQYRKIRMFEFTGDLVPADNRNKLSFRMSNHFPLWVEFDI